MRTKLKITEGIFPMPVLMVATYNEDGHGENALGDFQFCSHDNFSL